MIMRILAAKDIMKTVYKVEPQTLQLKSSIMMAPWMLKIIYGIVVDSKIVKKRKYYLVFFGTLCTVTQAMVVTIQMKEDTFVSLLVLYNFGAAILDAVIDSISVEQARKDPHNGQSDL